MSTDNRSSDENTTQNLSLTQLFEQKAAQNPHASAVLCEGEGGDKVASYADLNAQANRCAHLLRQMGVGEGSIVGVLMESSFNLSVALLGILKAGAAYLPLDPSHPPQRLAFTLEDAKVSVILSQKKFDDLLIEFNATILKLGTESVYLETLPDTNPAATGKLAYVIYTSGSTGQPKGCLLSHKAIVNRLQWMQNCYGLTPADRVLQKTPYTFDVSVWELFWPLITGATLVLAKAGGNKDSRYLVDLIQRKNITICHFVPTMLRFFLGAEGVNRCNSLRHIFASGEALPYDLMSQCLRTLPASLHNLYGPTEAAVDVTYWHCEERADKKVPIGKAIDNIRLYILDQNLRPVAAGEEGELCIAGVGLAEGYLNRPALLAEKFVEHPVHLNESRIYRTGDRARYLPDGLIEYLGRLDNQVKVGGQRIELGEIESVLRTHPAIAEAVVLAQEAGSVAPKLVAYLNSEEKELSLAAVRQFLADKLPEYMLPNYMQVISPLPVNVNGKLDRKALPWPLSKTARAIPEAAHHKPSAEIDKELTEYLCSLLCTDRLEENDDLFCRGATSLTLVQLAEWIHRRYGVELPVDVFLDTPFVARIAEMIGSHLATADNKDNPHQNSELETRGEPAASSSLQTRIPLQPVVFSPHVYREVEAKRIYSTVATSFIALSRLLRSLKAQNIDGKTKYLYASGGGLNPVQTYLWVRPGAVENMNGGAYYYHSEEHALYKMSSESLLEQSIFSVQDRLAFDGCHFALFFIAEFAAIEPLYKEASGVLAAVEAGYIQQLLLNQQQVCGIGLSPVYGVDFERIHQCFQLTETHCFLHCLLGGRIDRESHSEVENLYADSETLLNHIPRESRQKRADFWEATSAGRGLLLPSLKDPAAVDAFHHSHPHLRCFEQSAEKIFLPDDPVPNSHYEVRSCRRDYDGNPLSITQLSQVLMLLRPQGSEGIQQSLYYSVIDPGVIRIYLYVKPGAVIDLAAGLYLYHGPGHELAPVLPYTQTVAAGIEESYTPFNRKHFVSAGIAIYLLADKRQLQMQLGEEGLFAAMFEAGAMGQLLLERQAEFDVGFCPIGGVREHKLRNQLPFGADDVLLHSFFGGHFNQALPEDRDCLIGGIGQPSLPAVGESAVPAIVGFCIRLPGADSLDAFWKRLCSGKSQVSPVPQSRKALWGRDTAPDGEKKEPVGAFLENIDCFDGLLFNIAPVESRNMDPQERIMLELAWACLEDAGYCSRGLGDSLGKVGVFIGSMWQDYQSVGSDFWRNHQVAGAASDGASLANRVSYFFDCRGPSLSVNTSCSSSLTALHLACESLNRGECDAALVGGVNLLAHPYHHALLAELQLLSKTDTPRPFGAGADGWVPGEGAGMLLLKPLRQAQHDRDHVYAIIRQTSISHTGRTTRYTVPSAQAQASDLSALLRKTWLEPDQIDYIEAAAPGAAMADAAEYNALKTVFGSRQSVRTNPCWVGTVKGFWGHLEAASTFSQLAKVIVQMRHRKIVPCLNAQPISQFIGNGNSALSLADCIRDWQPASAEEPLRALINAFGAAGSGGHILLESCPAGAAATEYKSAINNRTQTLVVLSAASESQLRTLAVNLLNRLSSEENFSQEHISLQSLAYTLSVGRIELVERLALLVDGISALRNLLNKFIESSGSVSDDKVFRGRFLETYQPSPRSASIESVTEETLRAFAQKWVRGEVDLRPLTTYLEPRGGRRQSLPTYPFAQEKHWLTTTVENNAVPKPHVNPIFKSQTGQTPVNNHQSLVTLTERYLLQTFSKVSGIPEEHLYPAAPLKNYGINSLMITQLNTLLTQALGDTVSKTLFFEQLNLQGVALQLVHSHTEALEQWLRLQGGSDAQRNNERNSAGADRLNDPAPLTSRWGPLPNTDETSPRSEPAIIGLAGRYPKSETLAEFWDNLRAGRDCIAVIPEERWPLEGFYLPGQPIAGKSYNKWGGFLRNVDKFDALFFGIAPSVADLMDPQARLFLETAWETIEDAGYNRTELQNAYAGRVGVFAGVMYGDYQLYHGYITDDKAEQRTAVEGRVSYGSIAHQVSYALDLCGPSMAVDTMCSSSLTAIHLAAQSIQNGECLAAIVGGVNLSIHPGKFILQAQLGMSSTSGRCKSFGAGGDGFVPGEGVGAIFLKPYTRAQQDGDHIYGVIKATSINAGGETNGYTVPNPRAQAELVSTALGRAGIHPAAVSYIEAHGTGTALGDPIEITGLTQAFTSNAWESGQWSGKQRYCAIGSVKSNIGHCESAAGIAGVTKVLLQMKYRQLVPTLHTEQLNPNIDFGATPFKVQQTLQEWRRPILTINGEEKEFPRIAGVSSFGAGGANAHIIIAEHIAAATDLTQTVASEAAPVIVILSARSAEQLKEQAIRLRKAIETDNLSDRQLRDIAYTLQTGREAFEERLGLVVANIQALFAGLTDFIEDMPADNIYRGNTTKGENYLDLISSDDELQAGIARWVEKGLYDKLLRLWVKGLNFPWQRLYNDPENKPERISLPTYPFARESHWLPSAAPFRSVTGAAPLPGREYKTLWFSPEWHEVEIAAPAEKIMAVSKGGHRVFIIGDFQQSLVDALEKELPSVHCHWLQCFESDLSRRYEFYVTELIEHLQEILRTRPVDPLTVQVLLIADGREDDPSLCFSGVAGVLKSAARENPKLITQCIELDAAVTPEQVPGILLSNAAARYSDYHSANTKLEHFYQASDQYVRYCRGVRRLIRFVRCSLNTTTDAMLSPWRDKGVYLITGGTGGLGLIFAKAIAADSKGATLLLTGRREGNRATQALVDSLTALGAKAHYYRLDVSRREAVENFVDDTLRTFGKITGVLHCAGVIRDSSLIRKTRAEIQAVLAPKVAGLIHLDEAIGNHPLDFLLLFSSTSAMGNAGQADYAAANAFMDAYAHYRNARVSQGQRQGGTLSVNWPLWAEGGMQAGEAARIQMARSGLRPLDTGAGLEAAYFALNHAVTQLTVWCCDPVAAASAFHTVDTLPAAQPIAAAAPSSLTGLKEKTLQNLKAMLAGTISLSESRIDIGERWSAYGIDSIIINTLNRKLESVLGKIPQTLFYEYGTLNALAGFLAETYPRACSRWTHKRETAQIAPRQWEVRKTAGRDTVPGESDTGIAITGLSGRYAQANTPDEFWHNLKTGKNCIAEIPAERWPLRDFYLEDGQQAIIQGKSYSKWGGFIEGYADFDPLFFNMTPRDAELIDPQERLFLQVCHTALEDAGYVPSAFSEQLRQRTAVFGGVTRQGFNLHGRELAARFPATSFGSLVNRVSYFYDFKGPSVPVDTMCSSALVAIHLGCEYIRDGKGDLAIAGGVNLYSHPVNYIEACAAGLLAPGRTAQVFGNGGEGFVPGEGAGAVVLKSLSRAIGGGDGIYAVIKGSAINHGGKTNSYSTPSPQQQAAVIQQALAQAGIDPRSISYIEAAANGSAVGDAIEVAALQKVFGGRKNVQGNYAIGSVKPNIGHCESAAGISQLTKVIYALLDRSLPPTLSAIEQGDPVELPFQVQREFSHWNSVSVDGQPVLRRAGITGVGAGGVNAHIIVEEFLQQDAVQERILSRHLFVLSAQNRERLQEYAEKWLSYLQQQEAVDLTRIVYTLQTGREAMPCRLALVVADKGELEHKLAGWLKSSAGSGCHYGELIHGAAGLADAADSGRFDKYLHQDELDKLAHLWTQGVSFPWHRLYGNRSIIKHTRLPTYPFKRQKCWPSIPSWKQDRQTASKAVEYYTLGALAVPEAFFEDYLTFCPFEEKIHGFSMSRVFLNPTRYPEEWNLLRQKQTELRQVLFYKEDFQRIQTVLDFGCGHGTDVIQIARLYPHIRVHGYTITAAQAELGNKRIAQLQLNDRTTIFHRDSAADSFPSRYDLVIGIEVSFHIRDKRGLFANIARSLNDNSRVLLMDYTANLRGPIVDPHLDISIPTVSQWCELLAGNQLVIDEAIDVSWQIANFLHDPDVGQNTEHLPDVVQETFKNFANQSLSLEKGWISYCLFKLRKDGTQNSAAIATINAGKLANKIPYTDALRDMLRAGSFPYPPAESFTTHAPGQGIHQHLVALLQRVLGHKKTDIEAAETLSALGIGSVNAVELMEEINTAFHLALPTSVLFECDTLNELVRVVADSGGMEPGRVQDSRQDFIPYANPKAAAPEGIAIIGFSCRCAGAADPEALWALVSRAESHIQPIKNADWLDYIDASNADSGKTAKKSFQYGAMKGIDQFDALFFRISAAEAQAMDPAQRILLEQCYKALEHAGYSPASLGGRQVGTVIGSMNAAAAGDDHSHHSLLGTETSILSVRIAYFLDLKGPSLTINTSCSSSLVAVDTACEKLRNCSVDLCLAGGIGIYTHPAAFLAMENAGMLSPTGECRPFDAAANGIVVGDGVGVVILKRLRDAIADNDAVYGVIRGSGTNQDGRTSGITVPSFSAQSQLQVSIYKENHIDVEDIQYIEAHGTATRLGDPVEIHGLTHAFKQFTHKTGFCGIGSLKANIGHTGAAAGVLGLIKVLLGLKHRKIPPSINFGKHNSLIDFAQSPVYVNTALTDWPRNAKGSRLAAVNSFGFSGTNAHLVVEEYSAPTKPPLRAPVAIVFSAKTREQLKESARRLLRRLEAGHYGDADLTDMAFTLQTGRDAMAERLGIIADTVESLRLALADFINDRPDSDGLYYGRAAKQDKSGESLTSGGSLSREEYGLLLQQWVKGAALDWHRLYAGVRPGRIGLPTYPFARDSFPLKPVAKASVTRKTPMAASQIQREEAVAEETAGERQAVITAVLIQEKILRKLKKILAGVTQMEPGRLDSHEPLENYGLDSIMINRLNAELEKQFSELPKTLFFEYETLADLVGYLVEVYPDVCKQWAGLAAQTVLTSETGVSVRPQKNEPYIERNFLPAPARESEGDKDGIAVIGISGRFPQANTLEEFWENLKSGKNCITEIPPERWPLQGFYCENSKQAVAQGRSYSKWGGFIEGFAQFDPLFFNILPREAFNLDPQERLFIQCCWELLENAGYTRESLDRQFQGRVGVFAGITKTGFNLYGPPLWQRGEVDIPHTSFASLANRVSYLFNFRGPSMPVDTLCSASLTAVHEACEHMRRRECELAIAGGVNLYLHPSSYIGLCAQLMLSTDNKCKSFGSGGDGFVPGEGVGAVLLKRLSQARADGDQIVALIKATSINHGGRTSGYTVPNPAAQADVIADALRKADIDPRTVGYIEAHGTGTELGDPIEIAGLSQAFSRVLQVPFPPEMAYQYCAVGSVKSNLGHLEAAAGIAGLIKVILQMRHRQLVPSLHAQSLNPNIDWSKTPFKVQQTLQEWPQPRVEIGGHLQTYPRRAGVSSFGAGGANAHIVVEEYVEPCIQPAALPSVDVLHPALIVLSARTPEQLRIQARQLRDYIQAKKQTDRDLLKIAFTLQVGREAMAERLAFSAVNMPSLIARLTSFIEGEPPGDELYLGRVAQNGKRWSLFCMDEDLQYAMECWMEKGKYEKLLGFWVNGGTFNWRKCYTGKPPERIGLPTYPFATESYWVPAQIRGSVERNHGQEKNGGETLLLIPEWLPEPPPENSRQARADKHWVFLLRDFQRQHLAALSGSLPEWQCEWLQCGEPSLAACYEFYTLELFTRLQAVLRGLKHTALVQVAIGIGDSEELSCLAGLSGLLQTATRENPRLHTQCLLLEALPEPAALAALLRENAADYSRREIRYRRGMREVRQLRFLEHDTGTATPWKDKGVYLITGGMGGLGVIFAEAIASGNSGVTLVLAGRRALNATQQTQLDRLSRPGTAVEYRTLDVADETAVQACIAELLEHHGRIDGIFHCAGVIQDNFIIRKNREEITRVLAPKVKGLINLDAATAELPLDFLMVFSSVSALGNPGQADYAAANGFMDAFAHYRTERVKQGKRRGRTLSINWPLWAEGGMTVDAETRRRMAATGAVPLHTREGLSACCWAWMSENAQVIVLSGSAGQLSVFNGIAVPREGEEPVNGALQPQELRKKTLHKLKCVFADVTGIGLERIGGDTPLENFGLDSIAISKLNYALAQHFDGLPKTLFYECGTLAELADYLIVDYPQASPPPLPQPVVEPEQTATTQTADFAIIGLHGRYPQADTIDQYWENLKAGKDCLTEIPSDRWSLEGFYQQDAEKAVAEGKSYSKWGGFIADFADFDPLFFAVSPLEAAAMDPQERLFLQSCWHVLEDAGYTRAGLEARYAGRVGVFAGITKTGFELYGAELQQRGEIAFPYTSFSSVANRVSYLFNLHGPSIPVDTMCSASLTAVHLACESINRGECELAIAGGVNLYLHPSSYSSLCARGMLSAQGQCKSFGEGGSGFVPGEGVGTCLLKKLVAAQADRDHIYALIRSTSINHSGKTNGYTVPSPAAQADLISNALRKAQIDPRSISYIEAHGTGTALGDPIEIRGLTKAFAATSKSPSNGTVGQFCALGSVKSNLGHLEAAAGIAGLTKIVLQLQHRQLVPSLHAQRLNPNIDFAATPFKVQRELQAWQPPPPQHLLRAGISSFGAGGANAHVILEEYVETAPAAETEIEPQRPVVIVLSSRTAAQLKMQALNLHRHIRNRQLTDSALPDIAYTLQTGREAMEERLALAVTHMDYLLERLKSFATDEHPPEGIYRGTVKREQGNPVLFSADNATQEAILKDVVKDNYSRLLTLWVSGLVFDWHSLYREKKLPGRISLPVYPFAKERYWLQQMGSKPIVSAEPEIESGRLLIFEERWQKGALSHLSTLTAPVLICFLSDPLHQQHMQTWLQQQAAQARFVFIARDRDYQKHSAHRYSLRYNEKADYRQALTAIREEYGKISGIFYLWALQDKRLLQDWSGLVYLLQALAETRLECPRVLAAGEFANAGERCYLDACVGFERSLELILPDTRIAVIAKAAPVANRAPAIEDWSHILWNELRTDNLASSVYIDGKRHIAVVHPAELPPRENAQEMSLLRQRGTYLITGGCGGLGLLFAEYLAATLQANLVLTGRSAPDGDIERKLKTLRARGAQVFYRQADVCDRAAMETVVKAAEERFQKIDGVLHAAGLSGKYSLLDSQWEDFQSVLAPKIEGTRVVTDLFEQKPLDFIVYFSSSAAILGDFGACAYAAANRFQQAHALYSQRRNGTGAVPLVINWPLWKAGGMGFDSDAGAQAYLKSSGQRALDTAEGLDIFVRILSRKGAQNTIPYLVLAGQPDRIHRFLGVTKTVTETSFSPRERRIELRGLSTEECVLWELKEQVSQLLKIDRERLKADLNLADFGFDSIGLTAFSRCLTNHYGIPVTPAVFFSFPTLKQLAEHLMEKHSAALDEFYRETSHTLLQPGLTGGERYPGSVSLRSGHTNNGNTEWEPVAVIGISGRFPGARTVEELWRILERGEEAITEIPAERFDWREYYGDPQQDSSKTNGRWMGAIPGVKEFDPLFFEISPAQAETMDPRQRLLLQDAWNALEDAGYGAGQLERETIGMFVGVEQGDYQLLLQNTTGAAVNLTANHDAILASGLSYHLNLKGPVMAINTSCSSGLVAAHQACLSLQAQESDAALVAGVNLLLTPQAFVGMSAAGMLSGSGKCFAFDKRADGMVPGEAVAVIVLKRLSRALAEGDNIQAVIRGSGINYDGKTNGITAPSGDAQTRLLQDVYKRHGINPGDIGYILTHGTGTQLGDPVEINALNNAFKRYSGKKSFCALTSVKPNLGHTFAASGLVSLICLIQAMRYTTIPASLNCAQENDYIDWRESPFYINKTAKRWRRGEGQPRLGAVSAFGMSGTNAHMVVDSFEHQDEASETYQDIPGTFLLLLSAKTQRALQARVRDLLNLLNGRPWNSRLLWRMSYTLMLGRQHFNHRCALVVKDREEACYVFQQFAGPEKPANLFQGKCARDFVGQKLIMASALDLLRQSGSEKGNEDYRSILGALGDFYCQGYDLPWQMLFGEERPRRLSLPGYPFAGKTCWVTEKSGAPVSTGHLDADNESSGTQFYTTLMRDLINDAVSIDEAVSKTRAHMSL